MTRSTLRFWWRNRTRPGRLVFVFAAILAVQFAVALSTQHTILPAVVAITHDDNWYGELGPFLLFFIQLLLCIPTLAALVTAIAVIVWRSRRTTAPAGSVVPREPNQQNS